MKELKQLAKWISIGKTCALSGMVALSLGMGCSKDPPPVDTGAIAIKAQSEQKARDDADKATALANQQAMDSQHQKEVTQAFYDGQTAANNYAAAHPNATASPLP